MGDSDGGRRDSLMGMISMSAAKAGTATSINAPNTATIVLLILATSFIVGLDRAESESC